MKILVFFVEFLIILLLSKLTKKKILFINNLKNNET